MRGSTVLVVCVHYHNEKEVNSFVTEVLTQKGFVDNRIIVIDNSGDLGTSKKGPYDDCRVSVYRSGTNMGYYGGAHWGVNQYAKKYSFPDWIVVCNTDIHFMEKDFFEKLLHYHSRKPPNVISPIIFSASSGREWTAHMLERPSRRNVHLHKWLLSYYPTSFLYNIFSLLKGKILDQAKGFWNHEDSTGRSGNKPYKIYAPAGAFTIFHRSYFERGGHLNHFAFLYGEEIFVAETSRKFNLNVICDPRLKIIHRGYSTTSIFTSPRILHFKREAITKYTERFFSK